MLVIHARSKENLSRSLLGRERCVQHHALVLYLILMFLPKYDWQIARAIALWKFKLARKPALWRILFTSFGNPSSSTRSIQVLYIEFVYKSCTSMLIGFDQSASIPNNERFTSIQLQYTFRSVACHCRWNFSALYRSDISAHSNQSSRSMSSWVLHDSAHESKAIFIDLIFGLIHANQAEKIFKTRQR